MIKIIREPLKSSQVASIGYSAPTSELDVEFKGGAVYRYQSVPAELHQQIINAESIGHAINETLKKDPKRFPFVRLTKEQAAI